MSRMCSLADDSADARRWVVKLSSFKCSTSGKHFKWLLRELVPEAGERDTVMQFVRDEDRKRALLSRLLIRHCCRDVLGVECVIARTEGRKPYAKDAPDSRRARNFNFNVSHEGDYVILAAEATALCGADVCSADHMARDGPPNRERLANLADAFEKDEFAMVLGIEDARKRFDVFRVLWSCKEAVVKACGDGIARDLRTVTFRADDDAANPPPPSEAMPGRPFMRGAVLFNGTEDPRWSVEVHVFDESHVATVARGPAAAIIDNQGYFRATMLAIQAGLGSDGLTEEWRAVLNAPRGDFAMLTVADLVPADRQADYQKAIAKSPRGTKKKVQRPASPATVNE